MKKIRRLIKKTKWAVKNLRFRLKHGMSLDDYEAKYADYEQDFDEAQEWEPIENEPYETMYGGDWFDN